MSQNAAQTRIPVRTREIVNVVFTIYFIGLLLEVVTIGIVLSLVDACLNVPISLVDVIFESVMISIIIWIAMEKLREHGWKKFLKYGMQITVVTAILLWILIATIPIEWINTLFQNIKF